ncbi:MAG TPA: cytochrome c [Trueperaceae bacterium]|nr:cytochrome c [Trueperaceae bacterium]
MSLFKSSSFLALIIALGFLISACGANMYDQPKFQVNEANPYFANQSTNRNLPEGTVSRERGAISSSFLTGQDENGMLSELPIELSKELLQRGQERYNIYCAPCHNYTATGDGIIVQKGMPQPTSFLEPRLVAAPVGYYYGAMTNGFGRMFSYASRIQPEDRWAIAAYIKTLQFSQHANIEDIPSEYRVNLEGASE